MRMTKMLWIAVPSVFLVAIGLTLFGPKPELRPAIKLSQIAIVADVHDPEDVERVRSKIEAAYEELIGGADFAEVAEDKSEAPNASEGGAMGWMGEGRLPANLEEIAFGLEEGAVSEIIEEPKGEDAVIFRILYVEERRNF